MPCAAFTLCSYVFTDIIPTVTRVRRAGPVFMLCDYRSRGSTNDPGGPHRSLVPSAGQRSSRAGKGEGSTVVAARIDATRIYLIMQFYVSEDVFVFPVFDLRLLAFSKGFRTDGVLSSEEELFQHIYLPSVVCFTLLFFYLTASSRLTAQ